MACKVCGESGHNAATCAASVDPIGLVFPVGGAGIRRNNYLKVTRRLGERGIVNSIFVTFNDAIKADVREAHRLARSKLLVPGWAGATVAALRFAIGLPSDIAIVGITVEGQGEIQDGPPRLAPPEDERRIGGAA